MKPSNIRRAATLAALVLCLAGTAHAAHWKQKRIAVEDCAPQWSDAIDHEIGEWNACGVVKLRLVLEACPAVPNFMGETIAIFGTDDPKYTLGNTALTRLTVPAGVIVEAYTTVYNQPAHVWTDLERGAIIGHELGHAIFLALHSPDPTDIMFLFPVTGQVRPGNCAALAAAYSHGGK